MESFFTTSPRETHRWPSRFGGHTILKLHFLVFPDLAKRFSETGFGGIERGLKDLSNDTLIIFLRCPVLTVSTIKDFADHQKGVTLVDAYLPAGAFPGLTYKVI
jgi:hypothetical protein